MYPVAPEFKYTRRIVGSKVLHVHKPGARSETESFPD
jgi:hypothetical protein